MAAWTGRGSPSSPSRGAGFNDLNAIVHPAVIAAQQQWMDEVFARDPAAVAVVESALDLRGRARRPRPRRDQ